LWEFRMEKIDGGRVQEFKEEIRGFFYWFQNSVFEKEWTINQLIKVLKKLDKIQLIPREALNILLDYTNSFPIKVAECLEIIIKTEKKYDGIIISNKNYRKVIEAILGSGNEQAIEKISDLINYLGRHGDLSFRDLL